MNGTYFATGLLSSLSATTDYPHVIQISLTVNIRPIPLCLPLYIIFSFLPLSLFSWFDSLLLPRLGSNDCSACCYILCRLWAYC